MNDWNEIFAKQLKVRGHIKDTLQGGETRLIDCPVCNKKTLHAFVSSYNGHVHAHCENPECNISFME